MTSMLCTLLLTALGGCEETPLVQSGAILYTPGAPVERTLPLRLEAGPHLFIDDFLIETQENIERRLGVPQRDPAIGNPLISGKEDGCFQPYLTVLHDASTARFRMWYGRHTDALDSGRSLLGYIESQDGIHWERPARTLDFPVPIQFGVSVVDRGASAPSVPERFVFAWYMDGGLKLALSPDGFAWTPLQDGPVLAHNHDIAGLSFDPIRNRFTATVSVYRDGWWKDNRRITMHSHSADLRSWTPPRYVVLPDSARDSGETQYYAMDGYLARGGLLVGMVKVLRDDLKADTPPEPPDAYGMGYTELAWSRDGETWVRDTTPFFSPDPDKGAWDHAHAWIDEQLLNGDTLLLYYGGYAHGHKVNRFEERQIGLVRIPRDRYAGRFAGATEGVINTPPLIVSGSAMTVNAAVETDNGSLTAQLEDEKGTPIPGFSHADCTPIQGDAVALPLRWKRPFSEVTGQTIRIQFRLRNATIFAVDVSN